MFGKFFTALLITILILGNAFAADHYIREGATGNNNGSDWTNAWTALPATLVRGDTYWIADGQYGAYTFDDAESDTTSIMIRKATGSRHGTSTGWDNAYGDGQAEFTHAVTDSVTLWSFTTGNWIIDGGGRTSKTSGHGFKLTRINPGNWSVAQNKFGGCYAIYVRDSAEGAPDNFKFSYIEVQGVKDTFHWPNNGCHFYFERGNDTSGGPENVTIEYCYSHDCDWVHIISGGSENWLIQYNYFHWNYELGGYMHSQGWADYGSDNMIYRYNEMWDVEGTAMITPMGDHSYTCDNWQVYGNIFGYTAEGIDTQDGLQDGVMANTSGDKSTNSAFYNNTIINVWCSVPNAPLSIVKFETGSSGNAVRNNLIYNGDLDYEALGRQAHMYYTGIEADSLSHNTYIDVEWETGQESTEAGKQDGTGDPFTDLASGIVSLTAQTDAGVTLSLFTVDMLGNAYDDEGSWTRGALAYITGEGAESYRDWYVDRAATEDGIGTQASPLQASQVAGSVGVGATVYDITSTVTGANPLTIAVDSVTVKYKTGVGATPTIVGGLKTIEPVNLAVVGDAVPDSVLVLSGNRDGEMRQPVGNIATVDFTGYTMDAGESTAGGVSTMFIQMHPSVSNYDSMKTAYLRLSCAGTKTGTVNMLVYAIKNVATPADTTEAQETLASVSGSGVAWQIVNPASGTSYLSPNLASIINALDLATAGGDSVLFVITENGSDSADFFRARTYENSGTDIDPELVYEYQEQGVASDLYAKELTGAELDISKVYRDGKLMTSVDLADLDADNEYHISAAKDSLYVYGDGDGITADAYGPSLIISGNHCTVYGGIFVHGNLAGAIKISGNSCLVANCFIDSSAVGIAVVAGATGTVLRNNVFECDVLVDDDGTDTDESNSAFITGSDDTGLTDAVELSAYDPGNPPELVKGAGIVISGISYLGSAPEIGPTEFERDDYYYVRAGASGIKDGSSWTNAWATLPASLVRGNTYWIADGTYGAYVFDDDTDGTKSIYIRHANADSCGLVAGWAAELGDGQAVFSGPGGNTTGPFVVKTDYWVFDGMTGAGFGETPYGFKVALSDTADNATVVQMHNNVDHITLAHMEIDGTDAGEHEVYKPRSDGVYFRDGTSNVTIQNCWIHDCVRTHCFPYTTTELIIEGCYFEDLAGGNQADGDYIHCESISIQNGHSAANNHIRNNHFRNIGNTGGEDAQVVGFIVFTNSPTASDFHIYGNCFWQDNKTTTQLSSLYVGTDGHSAIDSVYIYHNTFYNLDGVEDAVNVFTAGVDVIIQNNIFYNCATTTFSTDTGTITHDYNASDADLGEAHDVALAANPFVDAADGDFNIVLGAAVIGAGADLGETYTPDGNGTTRVQTIGAFEYAAESARDKVTWHVSVDGEGAGKSAADAMIYTSIPDSVGTGDTVLFAAGTYPAVLTIPADSVIVRNEPGAVVIFGGAKPLAGWVVPAGGGDTVIDTLLTDSNILYNDSTHTAVGGSVYASIGRRATAANTENAAIHIPLVTTNFASWTSAKLYLYCTTNRTGTVKTKIKLAEAAAIANGDSDAYQEALAGAFADSLTFDITNPTAGTTYEFDITSIIDQLTIDGNNDLMVFVLDNGTATNNLYLRVAFIADAENPEPYLIFSYAQTGSPSNHAYVTGTTGVTRAWNGGIAATAVAIADLDLASEFTASDDTLYVAKTDTTGWTCDGYGANAIDFNEKIDVTVSGMIVKGTGFSGHAVRMDGLRGSFYNAAVDSAKKGVYVLADACNIKNVVFAVHDSTITDTANETDDDYNAWVTGFAQGNGAHDLLKSPDWTAKYTVPALEWMNVGYYPIASYIGPIEIELEEEEEVGPGNRHWYVDFDAVSNGTGTITSPFNSISALWDSAGTRDFVHWKGDASGDTVTVAHSRITFLRWSANTARATFNIKIDLNGKTGVYLSGAEISNVSDFAIEASGRANTVVGCSVQNCDGGVNGTGDSLRVESCVFYKVGSANKSAITLSTSSYSEVVNNTIYNDGEGYGISLSGSSGAVVKNNIVYSQKYASMSADSQSGTSFDFNCYYWTGSGSRFLLGSSAINTAAWKSSAAVDDSSTESDPKFLGITFGDLRTHGTSMCVDSGDPTVVFDSGSLDFLGSNRTRGDRINIGAIEVLSSSASYEQRKIINRRRNR